MIFRSLRWRVQRGHVFIVVAIMVTGWILLQQTIYSYRLTLVDQRLAVAAAGLGPVASGTGWAETPSGLSPAMWYRIADANGHILAANPTPPQVPDLNAADVPEGFSWQDKERVLKVRQRDGSTILTRMAEGEVYAGLESLPLILAAIGVILGSTVLLIGWWFAGKSLSPIQRFSESARRISQGKQDEALDLAGTYDELQELGQVLNDAFQSLHKSLAQQRQLTADASHELRTPLSVIILECESALRQERSDEEYRQRIRTSLDAALHLQRLVDGLLLLARSDADEMVLQCVPVRLDTLVEEAVQLMQPQLAKSRADVATRLAPVRAKVDADHLKQVVINLVSNAIEHGGAGVAIRVTLDESEGGISLKVEDNGPGIPASALPHVFDRFYRADTSRRTAEGHFGLGLAICKTTIEAHGGTMRASTSPMGGACVEVRLPRRLLAEEAS